MHTPKMGSMVRDETTTRSTLRVKPEIQPEQRSEPGGEEKNTTRCSPRMWLQESKQYSSSLSHSRLPIPLPPMALPTILEHVSGRPAMRRLTPRCSGQHPGANTQGALAPGVVTRCLRYALRLPAHAAEVIRR